VGHKLYDEADMSVKVTDKPDGVEKLRINEKKWTKKLMDAGWTAIPSVFIERQAAFGLDAVDMNILVHLSHYWWHPDKLPCPSVPTIAKAVGLKTRAVQKRLRALEAANLIEVKQRKLASNDNDTNVYSFNGLIQAATPFAEEILMKKAAARRRNSASRAKSPSLWWITRPNDGIRGVAQPDRAPCFRHGRAWQSYYGRGGRGFKSRRRGLNFFRRGGEFWPSLAEIAAAVGRPGGRGSMLVVRLSFRDPAEGRSLNTASRS
jgi:hypothetical protein